MRRTLSEYGHGDLSVLPSVLERPDPRTETRHELYRARLLARRALVAEEWHRSGSPFVLPVVACTCGALAHTPDRGCDFSGDGSP